MFGELILRAADFRDSNSIAARFRSERFRIFATLLKGLSGRIRILDVGGGPWFWIKHRAMLPANVQITLVNLEHSAQPHLPFLSYTTGDARQLAMFHDSEFDACFCNSVIEHVGSARDQALAAKEIRRVAKGYFVQTPNRYFPIEPHFLVPGWQFAPITLRTRLLMSRDLGWMKREPDPIAARAAIESIHLLSERDIRQLFPDGRIHREKLGPFTKSITAYRPVG